MAKKQGSDGNEPPKVIPLGNGSKGNADKTDKNNNPGISISLNKGSGPVEYPLSQVEVDKILDAIDDNPKDAEETLQSAIERALEKFDSPDRLMTKAKE